MDRGSTVHVTGWFDNSSNNPANPDPNQVVRWGDQTYEEMMLGYVEYYDPNEKVTANSKRESSRSGTQPRTNNLSQSVATRAFRRYDKDGDGKVTREELGRPQIFETLNQDGNDYLTLEEVLKGAGR